MRQFAFGWGFVVSIAWVGCRAPSPSPAPPPDTPTQRQAASAAPVFPAGFQESVVFGNLTQPTVVQFAADGRVFVAQKRGDVLVFDGLDDPTPTVFADLRTNVHNYWDRGLLGMALHPQFPAKPYIYVLYTVDAPPGQAPPVWKDDCPNPPGPTTNGCIVYGRLSRLRANGNTIEGAEEILLEGWPQQFPSHSMGALAFGADGALYATGGDGASFTFSDYGQKGDPPNPLGDSPVPVGTAQTIPTSEGGSLRSQSLRRQAGGPALFNGAVVRLDPETGAPLGDNPLIGSADPVAQRIIASGLRNPFRITVRPGTNELWVADVGNGGWEEIDVIADPKQAKNFGWPCYEGKPKSNFEGLGLNLCKALYADTGAVTDPFFTYAHTARVVAGESCSTGSSAISAISFYTGNNYPQRYKDALFFADYSRNCAWAMLAGADGAPDPTHIETFGAGMPTPVDFKAGPDGDLYYVDIEGGAVKRVRYLSPTAVATANVTSGVPPLVVSFDGTASAGAVAGDVLTYAWDLDGDGSFDDGTGPKPSTVYPGSGNTLVRLKVTDQRGISTTSAALAITVSAMASTSTPPVPVIDSPAASLMWKVGDVINFSGHATDAEEGALPVGSLRWLLVMQHCPDGCHAHVIQTWDGVAGGSFSAPDHEYPSYLQLVLVATDATGTKGTATLELHPNTKWITLQSTPSALRLLVAGEEAPSPTARPVIEGSTVGVTAPVTQTRGANTWAFTDWSDGAGASHDVTATTDLGLTAHYRAAGLTGEYFAAKDLTVSKVIRTDATVNFDWGTDAPDPALPVDTFSARWTGWIESPAAATYTFYTDSDDGVRLWIDGNVVIDSWTDHAAKRDSGTATLAAGQRASVKLEYYDAYNGAVAKLWWSSPQQALQIVPAERLIPACATGGACGPELLCQAGVCVDACAGKVCDAGTRCEAGACVDACKDVSCPQGKCAAGKCTNACTDVSCAAGQKCKDGACVDACVGVSCPTGQRCEAGACVDACLGVQCAPSQVCQLAMCIDPCAGVMCTVGQKCAAGACVDACQGVTCPGQKCKLGACVDLCTDVSCTADKKCVDGACVDLCTGVSCPTGQKCASGACVDACQGIACATGERCVSGQCVPACTGVVCPQGQKCVGGSCVSNCTGVTCPAGEVCQAGACVNACSIVTCGAGQVCQAGTCVDGCSQIQCPRGQVCTAGSCVDLCAGLTCGPGLLCESGACVDPCLGLTCDAGKVCRLGACVEGCAGVNCNSGQKCQGGTCVPVCEGITCTDGEKCLGGECVSACTGVSCPLGQTCTNGACMNADAGVDASPDGAAMADASSPDAVPMTDDGATDDGAVAVDAQGNQNAKTDAGSCSCDVRGKRRPQPPSVALLLGAVVVAFVRRRHRR